MSLELKDWEELIIDIAGGRVRVDLDDFGQINWFYIKNIPGLYDKLMGIGFIGL